MSDIIKDIEDAFKKLRENHKEPTEFLMSRSYYEKGVEIFGEEKMQEALKKWNTKIMEPSNG